MRRIVVGLLSGVALCALQCGSSKDRAAFLEPSTGQSIPGTDGTLFPDAGNTITACGVETVGVCDCAELDITGDRPNIYFVLDRSGSMAADNLWKNVTAVVLDVVLKLGPRANFGAAIFPGSSTNACAAGDEIMSVRQGDSPAGLSGPTWRFLHDRTVPVTPKGGTPTAATLANIAPKVKALTGKTFVVLATDGGPNCNDRASCSAAECTYNIDGVGACSIDGPSCCADAPGACLDSAPTIAQVQDLAEAGISTYVIGVPGSNPYTALLNSLAEKGGTARQGASASYYKVDTADKTALSKALSQVAAKIVATCTFELKEEPAPGNVNVYLDTKVVPKEPVNGWKLEGKTVTLVGTTCDRVLSGDALDVRVIVGCPTVAPK